MARNQESVEGSQFVKWFGPVLDALRSLGGSGTPGEVVDYIVREYSVPEEVVRELTDAGIPRFYNHVAWARFYLTKEGLLGSSKRGVWNLTETGWPTHLTAHEARALYLKWVKIHAEERKRKQLTEVPAQEEEPAPVQDLLVPRDFRTELLETISNLPPAGFERLCQRLLRESGFIQVVVTGRSGDGGIDGYGTLQVNSLVSFKVLFQCKRFTDGKGVTPSHVRDFRGAMQGRTDQGIILTTGTFSSEARKEATRDGVPPIELVDGQKLVAMFEKLELGLKPVTTFEVDDDFFNEFREAQVS